MSEVPGQRCEKLRLLMQPSTQHTWGRSSNSVAVEVGIHLNLFISFLKSKGLPEKWNVDTQKYSSQQLNTLVQWIDLQEDPIPKENPKKTSNSSDEDEIRRLATRNATHLDEFLEGIDIKFIAYADKLIRLGVMRPGDISKLTLEDLINGGIKKLHARRIKSHPSVFDDVAVIEYDHHHRDDVSITPSEQGEIFIDNFIKNQKKDDKMMFDNNNMVDEDNEDDENEVDLGHQLAKLLQQAEAIGMSGEELDHAKKALERQFLVSSNNNSKDNINNNISIEIKEFLENIGDDHFIPYGSILMSLGITRPAHLIDIELNVLKQSGVKTLHGRRLKSHPTVFMDAADMASASEQQFLLNSQEEGMNVEDYDDDVDGWENVGESYLEEDDENDDEEEEEYDDEEKEKLGNQLTELLEQANQLGLSGPEIEAAKQTLGN